MFAEVLRLAVANVISVTIGFLFYNQKLNPLARTLAQLHTSKKDYRTQGMFIELAGTCIANTVLALMLMRFMEERGYSLFEVGCLAFKITLISAALQATHYLWKQAPLIEMAINSIYDFLVLSSITFTVTFLRHRKLHFF